MPFERIVLPSEGHTLASMLRDELFASGATFAACIVTHPLDTDLVVEIEHPSDCKECLLTGLREVRQTLTQYRQVVKSRMLHDEMTLDDSMDTK